jgi:hypothetical protein
MAINSISNTALQGIQRGLKGIRQNASEIASASQSTQSFPTKNTVRAMVELNQNATHTQASVKAFQTSNQIIGSLLDIKA